MRATLAGLLAAGLLLFAAYRAGEAFAQSRLPDDPGELRLFPAGPWVRPLVFGRTRLAADLAWLQAIQYYGLHRKTDRKYPYAETLFTTLTGLDPGFEEAYIFGALILAEDAGRPEAARSLLADGMRHNPESWRLCFEAGFLCYLRKQDPAEAARVLARAAAMPGAPASVRRIAAAAAGRAGEREVAIALWTEMLRTTGNEEIRRIALRSLAELGVDEPAVEEAAP